MTEYSVNVYYNDGPDCERDDIIDTIAQECGGQMVGAGTMVGTGERDVQCAFDDESDAARFQRRVEKELDWFTNISEIERW